MLSSDSAASSRPGMEAATRIRARNLSPSPMPSLIPKVAQSPRIVLSSGTRFDEVPACHDHRPHPCAAGDLTCTSL